MTTPDRKQKRTLIVTAEDVTDYAGALKEAGRETPEIVQAGCNHFDVLFALTNEGEELHQSVKRALEV